MVIPSADIARMVVAVPDGPTECNDETKVDFETLMIDPIMGDLYLIQKNIFTTDVNIYKVRRSMDKIYMPPLGPFLLI